MDSLKKNIRTKLILIVSQPIKVVWLLWLFFLCVKVWSKSGYKYLKYFCCCFSFSFVVIVFVAVIVFVVVLVLIG